MLYSAINETYKIKRRIYLDIIESRDVNQIANVKINIIKTKILNNAD